MSILAMIGAAQVPTLQPNSRAGFTTPEPVYLPPPPPLKLAEQTGRMQPHERAQVRAAAVKVKRLYPGAIGEMVSRELVSWEEFGRALGRNTVIMRAVHDILTAPEPSAEPPR